MDGMKSAVPGSSYSDTKAEFTKLSDDEVSQIDLDTSTAAQSVRLPLSIYFPSFTFSIFLFQLVKTCTDVVNTFYSKCGEGRIVEPYLSEVSQF